MFSASIHKTLQPHLHRGEEVLAAVLAQASGASAQMLAHAVGPQAWAVRADAKTHRDHENATAAADQAGVRLDRKMVIAVTTRRLLLFKAGGAFTVKAGELLGEVPIGDVDAISVDTRGLVKPVTVHVRGTAIGIETARGQPVEDLPRALADANAVAA